MDVTAEILTWSASLPLWQRDSLRRLAMDRVLEDDDLDQLMIMLKGEHGLVAQDCSPTAIPLDAKHLPDTAPHSEAVALLSISEVQNAMRLKSERRSILFPAV